MRLKRFKMKLQLATEKNYISTFFGTSIIICRVAILRFSSFYIASVYIIVGNNFNARDNLRAAKRTDRLIPMLDLSPAIPTQTPSLTRAPNHTQLTAPHPADAEPLGRLDSRHGHRSSSARHRDGR